MRSRSVSLALVLLAACGGSSPTAPPPPPITQPPITNMLGGWSGTSIMTWTVNNQAGSRSCTETWLISNQTNGSFTGTFQVSGDRPDCVTGGTISGDVTPERDISVGYHTTTSTGPDCTFFGGPNDGRYHGIVGSTGSVTLQANFGERCNGYTYNVTHIISMQKR